MDDKKNDAGKIMLIKEEKPTPFLKRVADLEKLVKVLEKKLEAISKALKGR